MIDEEMSAVGIDELSADHRALLENAAEILRPRLERSVVAFFDPDDPNQFSASGTLVEFRDRRWIATAGHVIEALAERPASRVAWAPSGRVSDFQDTTVHDVTRGACGFLGGVDIGAILLREAASFAGADFVLESQLDVAVQPQQNDDVVYLIGSAKELRDRLRLQAGLPAAQVVTWLGTHIRNQCHEADHCANQMKYERLPGADYHVDWSRAARPGEPYQDLFVAGGMSGGGLWCAEIATADDPVWSAESPRLIGVPWYHDRGTRCVRAVPFGAWFEQAEAALEKPVSWRDPS